MSLAAAGVLTSNCGLCEGCALSVFGMALVDWMLDWWLSSLDVSVDLRTFVDDWGGTLSGCQRFLPCVDSLGSIHRPPGFGH